MTHEQRCNDAFTEFAVENAYQKMMAAKDEATQRHWCDRLHHWIAKRGPERVRESHPRISS